MSATGGAAPQVIGYPRTCILAIGGDETGNQHYGTAYQSQVNGQGIATNGFFPIASYPNGSPCAWMGRFDIVVLGGQWEGWDDGGTYDRALLVDAIHQICNTTGFIKSKVCQYQIMESDFPIGNASCTYPTWDNVVANELWFLYSSPGETGSVPSSFFASGMQEKNWAINTSTDESYSTHRLTAPLDGSPEDMPQNGASYFCEMTFVRHSPVTTVVDGTISASAYTDTRYSGVFNAQMKAPNMDAIFIDNCFSYPRTPGYYDLVNNYGANVWNSPMGPPLVRGDQHLWNRWLKILQNAYPSRTYFRMGNLSSWAITIAQDSAPSYPVWNALLAQCQGYLDGGLNELEFGAGVKTWTDDNYLSLGQIITAIDIIQRGTSSPQLVITGGIVDTSTDWQSMRYICCAILMSNNFIQICYNASDYYSTSAHVWLDEFGGNPGTNIGKWWLGQPISGVQTSPSINGVFVRDFTNGTVLANPPGNGAQTITNTQINNVLGTSYNFSFIQGQQETSMNSGGSMSSVTLQARDGVCLIH